MKDLRALVAARQKSATDAAAWWHSLESHPMMRFFPGALTFAFDEELRFVAVGGQSLRVTGWQPMTLRGRTLGDAFPPEVVGASEPSFRGALAGRESTVRVGSNGNVVVAHLGPLRNDDGRIVGGFGWAQDDTTAGNSDRDLRESQERFRLAFEHAPIAKALIGLDGRYLMVNPAMCAFTGYSELELLAMSMTDIAYPEDLAADLAAMDVLLNGERSFYSMDKRYVRASGEIVWGFKSVTLVRSDDGVPLHFISQIQDVTDRRQHEQLLLEERRRLRDAEATGRLGSWERDLTTDELTWSAGMFALWEMEPGRSVDELYAARARIHPDDRPALDEAVEGCRTHGRPFQVRYRVNLASGALRWFDVRGEARYEEGRRVRIGGTVIDVTEQVTAQEEAARAHALVQAVVNATPDIIAVWDFQAGASTWSNRPIGSMLGYSEREIAEFADDLVGRLVHEEDRDAYRASMVAARRAPTDDVGYLDYRMIGKDGSVRWFSRRSAPLERDAEGRVKLLVGVIRETTQEMAMRAALQDSEERFRQLAENIEVGFVLRSLNPFQTLYVSPAYRSIFGHEPVTEADALEVLQRFIHPDDQQRAIDYWRTAAVGQACQAELRVIRPDGEVRWVLGATVPVADADGVVRRIASTAVDIHDRKMAEAALLHQSLHDPLTGLPNRNLLGRRISEAAQASKAGSSFGLLFIDLDGFKKVNDTAGHAAGDELLRQVADRLRHAVRPGDTVARLGGDEFAIVCSAMAELDDVRGIADRVLAAMSEPFHLASGSYRISASIGLELASGETDPDQVFTAADSAMYLAKATGGNRLSMCGRPAADL